MEWIRYRFETNSVSDYRPLIFNPKYPYWCSGYSLGMGYDYRSATIIAWLPKGEDLKKYWDDAFNIEQEEYKAIEFNSRFTKPAYFVES